LIVNVCSLVNFQYIIYETIAFISISAVLIVGWLVRIIKGP
jgi:hypothetical protein